MGKGVDSEPTSNAMQMSGSRTALCLVIVYIGVLVGVLAGVSWLIWNKGNPIIMFVPVAIWEWSFAGGIVAVLHRLGSPRLSKPEGLQLYSWAVSTPIVGLFLGAIVYFVALAGARLVGGSGTLQDASWLNVVAFFGGFRSDLSIRAIRRFFTSRIGEEEKEHEGA